ncbi:hypothetical protein B0H14DRAFT_3497924 [Mycena olivaceomarginata]|nr:hypothetical protein B0H14DRAFT_3497924 [Mycena olivaceomarginata]
MDPLLLLLDRFCSGRTPEGCDFIASYPNFADVRTGFNQYLKRAFPHDVRDKRALDPEAAAPSLDDLNALDPADEQEVPAAKPVHRKKPAATKNKAPELPAPELSAPELPVSTAAIPLTMSPLVSGNPISPTQDFPAAAGFDERMQEIVADFGETLGGSGLPLNKGWSSGDESFALSFGPDDDVLESWRSIGFDSAGEDIPREPSHPNRLQPTYPPRPMYRGGAAVNREIGASLGQPRATSNIFNFAVSPTFYAVPSAAQTVSATALPLPEQPAFPSLPLLPLHAVSTSTPTPSPRPNPAVDIRCAIRHTKDIIKHAMDPPTFDRVYVRHVCRSGVGVGKLLGLCEPCPCCPPDGVSPHGNPPAEKPAAAKKWGRPAKSKGPAATPVSAMPASAAAAPAPEGDENEGPATMPAAAIPESVATAPALPALEGDENGTGDKAPAAPAKGGGGGHGKMPLHHSLQ